MSNHNYYQPAVAQDYKTSQYHPNPQSPYQSQQPQPPLQQPSQQQQQSPEGYLCAAFPSIDRATVGAILASTRGEVGPAYNALLAVSGANHYAVAPPPQYSSSPYSSQSHLNRPLSPALPPRPSASPAQQPSTDYLHPQHHSPPYHANGPTSPAVQSPNVVHQTPLTTTPSHNQPAPSPLMSPRTTDASSTSVSAHTGHNDRDTAPPSYSNTSESLLPDMRKLSLGSHGAQAVQGPQRHRGVYCDGCSEDIAGNRWHCRACEDYDLCDRCREAGTHKDHTFKLLPVDIERHEIICDGCAGNNQILYGIRYSCLKHDNEDFCEDCIHSKKACGGPYKEHKQTALDKQIERDGHLPMLDEWLPQLGRAVATYNLEGNPSASRWLESPDGLDWYDVPKRERRKNPTNPVYRVAMKQHFGRYVSDHSNSWTMTNANGTKLYTYLTEYDRKTNAIKKEEFGPYKSEPVVPGWERTARQDCLPFDDIRTKSRYSWLSNRPMSTLRGERFDFQRNVLVEHRGHGKDRIVADWTWWDGHQEPEDCLTIRDPNIDHAMVIASLCVLHDYQWRIISSEVASDPEGVTETENRARMCALGCQSHWYLPDAQSEVVATEQTHSTTNAEKVQIAKSGLKLAGAIFQLANTASGMANN